jgi:hypothetical protein
MQVQNLEQPSTSATTAHPPAPVMPFSPAEWQSFRTEDKLAGTAIVCIMLGIFTIGLIMYAVISLVTASG